MSDDPACQAPQAPSGAVQRTCVPFAHVPAVPVVAVPCVPVPVPSGLPVLSVAGVLPDRTGNVDVTRFLEEWAAEPLAGKADKVVPAASGNFAGLDASGNLVDSGSKASDFATPSQVASQVAAVVASAPENLDTLKEIADVIGQVPASGTVMSRLSALESGKADSSSLAAVATSGSYDDLSDRPTIPAAVAVDATLTTQGAAADAKAVGDALRGGFTEWEFSGVPSGYTIKRVWYETSTPVGARWVVSYNESYGVDVADQGSTSATELTFLDSEVTGMTATRRLITPTKTSQLTNDGDGTNAFVKTNDTRLSNARTPTAHMHAMSDVTGLNAALAQKADAADLPYALVEPGKWEFSGSGVLSGHTYSVTIVEDGSQFEYDLNDNGSTISYALLDSDSAFSIDFSEGQPSVDVTATRPLLPGHLCDRAVNAVSVTGATALTLPEKIDGKSRDFYVRLTVSAAGDGSAVTFSSTDSGGGAVAWDSMGDPSGTFAEGTYLYRITESDEGLMHAEDMMALEGVEEAIEQINDGTATPSALDMKLDATSAAPAFDPTLTYIVGEYVTYGGILYRCKTAVTVVGPWTGDSNWVDVDMTSPDATLDVRSDGRLAVVAADSEILWIQGYDMASASDVVLSCERVNFYAFASGTVTQTFNMPSAPGGKVGDFVLDIDNSANASTAATATLNGFGTSFDVIVPKGQNLFTDILSFEGGEMCELYFTMTAFGTAAKPAWKVVKQVVEKQEAGS